MAGVRDSLVVTWRNLKRIPRIPELAIFAILQSIMFVLLFAVVFGGAILLPGYENDPDAYREYLMPGIFAQNIVFAAGITAIGITDDVGKGDHGPLPVAADDPLVGAGRPVARRCRLQPRHPHRPDGVRAVRRLGRQHRRDRPDRRCRAGTRVRLRDVLAGHLARAARPDGRGREPGRASRSSSRSPSCPTPSWPSGRCRTWLQPIAEWNPTSTLTSSLRTLWGNPNPVVSDSIPSQYPIPITLLWIVIFVAVFAPLSVRHFRNMSR